MNEKWDERYSGNAFAYGKEPNLFFKKCLQKFEAGTILIPADGKGRNGVYAAQLGWQVTSFDLSTEGRSKALQLANENEVTIDYMVGDFEQLEFEKEGFDAIGLIYAHFPANKKSLFHKRLVKYLKPGGVIIFEAFSKKHLSLRKQNPKVGGPINLDMLFSKTELMADFDNYEVILLEEEEVILNEGSYHVGKGSVIRFVGRKRNEQ